MHPDRQEWGLPFTLHHPSTRPSEEKVKEAEEVLRRAKRAAKSEKKERKAVARRRAERRKAEADGLKALRFLASDMGPGSDPGTRLQAAKALVEWAR